MRRVGPARGPNRKGGDRSWSQPIHKYLNARPLGTPKGKRIVSDRPWRVRRATAWEMLWITVSLCAQWQEQREADTATRASQQHDPDACVSPKSLQSCLTLCDPMDYSPPGSSIHGILQARMLEYVTMPSSFRRSSQPRSSQPESLMPPALAGGEILYHWATKEAHFSLMHLNQRGYIRNETY